MDRLVSPTSLFYGGRSQFNPWMKGEFMVEMVDNGLDWWDFISLLRVEQTTIAELKGPPRRR